MALQTARLIPPLAEQTIDPASGRPTAAWSDYFQGMVDQLANLRASQGKGVTDGSDATAGNIGEYLTASASGVALGSGAAHDVVTLALTAGDWDVSGVVTFSPSGISTHLAVGVGTSTTIGVQKMDISATFPSGSSQTLGSGMPVRINVAAASTAHLVALASFAGSCSAAGTIAARRAR